MRDRNFDPGRLSIRRSPPPREDRRAISGATSAASARLAGRPVRCTGGGVRGGWGPIRRPGGTTTRAERPRTSSGSRGRTQRVRWVAAGRRVALGADVARVDGGAPRAAGRPGGGAGEVPQDLVDHRRLGDAGDDAHGAVARRAREGVDLEDLLQKRRPPAGGLGRRQAWRAADGGGRTSCGRLGLTPHAARAIGVPAMVARGHVPFSSFVRPSERHALTSASLTSLVGRRKVLDAFTEWLCSESLACYNEGVAGRD